MSAGGEKIWVTLDRDESGYPPWEEEWLWAESVADSDFRVLAAPTFARGMSVFDIVRAVRFDDRWFAERVIESSGHSTLRVILFRDETHDDLLALCSDHGCDALHTEIPGLFAIDIPPSASFMRLRQALQAHADSGDWDIDEANVASAHQAV